ncbi:MAG: hypothetical protein J6P28_03075 [Treponema sp.]|nr:hypothetical protein [Treponema sp.]
MKVEEILKLYNKEVIIKWVTNRYPLFLNKDLKKELDKAKRDLEFDKANTELNSLFEKNKKLRGKPFNIDVVIEMEKNHRRIDFLIEKQEKLLGLDKE